MYLDFDICLYFYLYICDTEKYSLYWRGNSACIIVPMQLAFFQYNRCLSIVPLASLKTFSLLHVFSYKFLS